MQKKSSLSVHRARKHRGKTEAKSRESLLENPLNIDLRRFNSPFYKKMLRDVSKNPISYLAGGVSAFLIGRFMYRYYKNHPAILDFLKENFESVEEKLKEFRGLRKEDYAH